MKEFCDKLWDKNYLIIILLFSMFIGMLYFPFIFLFGLVIALLFLGYQNSIFTHFSIFLLCLLLALLNMTKLIEGDLVGYNNLLLKLRDVPFNELLSFKYITFDGSEPFFLVLAYLSSNEYLGIKFLVFITSFLTFYFFIYSQTLFINVLQTKHRFNNVNGSKLFLFFVIICTALFSITFVMSGHLVKQYLAMGVAAYSISLFFYEKKIQAFLWSVLAVLVHNSMLSISLSILIIPLILQLASKKTYLVFICLVIIIFTFFVKTKVFMLFPQSILLTNDGNIPVALYLLDMSILLLLSFTIMFTKPDFKVTSQLVFFIILHGALLLLVNDIGLFALRVYFTFDVFRAFILTFVCFLLISNTRPKSIVILSISILMVPIFLTYFLFRLLGSEWTYGLHSEQFYLLTILDLIN